MAAEAFVSSHFGRPVGSPSFPGWLTKGLEKRLQTMSLKRANQCTSGSADLPSFGDYPRLQHLGMQAEPEYASQDHRRRHDP
jgi:hypothetical protein